MTNCSLTIWLRLDSDREILPLESAPQTTGNESFSRMLFFHQQIWIQMYSNLCPVNQVHECLCVCRKCCILCFVWSSKSAVRATYGWADNKRNNTSTNGNSNNDKPQKRFRNPGKRSQNIISIKKTSWFKSNNVQCRQNIMTMFLSRISSANKQQLDIEQLNLTVPPA